ncbi:helix-turn-helix domain-containing protein [Pontiella sulfatireligans]|uniref:Helix-turn-helix domain-containing protein n=1 Tax=Pontiella sulfatireligans TaxID=2750658 RepID=A0A6C2UN65_9BACT|nr:helix-turn-helix domain-containing protein [Pontiella sulfatireligans]VGO21720.1 hypothetical protein SCARR_03794 [Pontiella sulfatireligans]
MLNNLKLLPLLDAADILGVSKRTVDRLIACGELPVVKINRSTRIPLAEIQAYIERNTFKNKVMA